jgi:hypothetical protein
MTTTSTDTMIFIASWLEPRPPAPDSSVPDGAGDNDDDVPVAMSRRWPAGHVMAPRRSAPAGGPFLVRTYRCVPMIDRSERGKEEKDVRMPRTGVGVSEAMVATSMKGSTTSRVVAKCLPTRSPVFLFS